MNLKDTKNESHTEFTKNISFHRVLHTLFHKAQEKAQNNHFFNHSFYSELIHRWKGDSGKEEKEEKEKKERRGGLHNKVTLCARVG